MIDPLLAKIMVHEESRDEAIASMSVALAQTTLKGPPTNLGLLQAIVQSRGKSSLSTHQIVTEMMLTHRNCRNVFWCNFNQHA